MKRALPLVLVLALLTTAALAPTSAAQAAEPERWLHVKVDSHDQGGEMVRVNVPLSLAEKILPTINHDKLHNGKVTIGEVAVNDIDLRALLEAVRNAKDGEYVTVHSRDSDVRVAKSGGYLLVEVRENKKGAERVDIKVPLTVVEALLSAGKDELDVLAAVRALAAHGDTELVTVKDDKNTVRIWVDSHNTSE